MNTLCICTRCHEIIEPKLTRKGSAIVAVILLICGFLPGVIYCVWMISTRAKRCPKCGSEDFVPFDTPRGREIYSTLKKPEAKIED
jgi:RNA polymerase subunit RPABC4/transcription elongation factor Spt4